MAISSAFVTAENRSLLDRRAGAPVGIGPAWQWPAFCQTHHAANRRLQFSGKADSDGVITITVHPKGRAANFDLTIDSNTVKGVRINPDRE